MREEGAREARAGAGEVGVGAGEVGAKSADVGAGTSAVGAGTGEVGAGTGEVGAREVGAKPAEAGAGVGEASAGTGEVGAREVGAKPAEVGAGTGEVGAKSADADTGSGEVGAGAGEVGAGSQEIFKLSAPQRVLAALGAGLIALWLATLRVRRLGSPIEEAGVITFWHGDQLPLLRGLPARRRVAPVSRSRDGAWQAALLAHRGVAAVRGSTSRGGLAVLRGLYQVLCTGGLALIAVDGPRGPARIAQPGALWLARRARTPLWPVGVAVSRGWRLRRPWDRFLLPMPFARVVIWVAPPLDQGARPEQLTEALLRAGREARERLQGGQRP